MLDDKIAATDWEATQEELIQQVARESYLQWLCDTKDTKTVCYLINKNDLPILFRCHLQAHHLHQQQPLSELQIIITVNLNFS
jgi:endo-1,4-beta-D-glucanase Y